MSLALVRRLDESNVQRRFETSKCLLLCLTSNVTRKPWITLPPVLASFDFSTVNSKKGESSDSFLSPSADVPALQPRG